MQTELTETRRQSLNREYQAGRWYYAQGFTPKDSPKWGSFKIIIFAKDKQTASQLATQWQTNGGRLGGEFHLYKNNYKRDAKTMIGLGQWIGEID